MKTRVKKAAAGMPLPTAHPSPGELTKVPPAELAETEPAALASAESGESPATSRGKTEQRVFAVVYAALAAVVLALGEEAHAMLLVACALSAALEGETRWRVPKLVKVCVTLLVAALSILMIVLVILKSRGR